MLLLALGFLIVTPVVIWLFPENTGNRNHYDGDFGKTEQTLRPLDSLTDEEHNAVGAFFGYCEGDTHE